MNFNFYTCLRYFVALLIFSSISYAENIDYKAETGELTLKLGAGLGRINSPLDIHGDIDFYALPAISYYGESFYIENAKLGYNLFESENFIIDAVGRFNRDGIYYQGSSLIAPLIFNGFKPDEFKFPDENAKLSYLAGLQASYYFENDIFVFGMLNDVTNVHGGYESEFSWLHLWPFDSFNFSTELGVIYKSDEILNYYYGTPLTEDNENYYVKIDFSYPITDKFWFVVNYHGEKMSNAILSSQAVNEDAEYLHTYFIGITWINQW